MSPSLVILSVGCLMGLACLSSGVVLLFKRGRRDQLEIEIPKIGKVKTGEVGIGLVSFGVVFFVISIWGYSESAKAEKLGQQLDKFITNTARELREEYRSIVDYQRPPTPKENFARVNFLIQVLRKLDPENGHAAYYSGEVCQRSLKTGH